MKALIRNIKVLVRCVSCDTEVVFPPSPVSEGIIPAAGRAHDLDVTVSVCLTVWSSRGTREQQLYAAAASPPQESELYTNNLLWLAKKGEKKSMCSASLCLQSGL